MTTQTQAMLAKATADRYAALRNTAPDLFRRCVEAASALAMRHGLSIEVTVAVENALVAMALEGMAVT